jgi:uncharacterized membrane protein
MKKLPFIISILLFPQVSFGCTTCNKGLQEQIKTSLNFQNLVPVFLIVLLITLILVIISKVVTAQHNKRLKYSYNSLLNPAPILTAALTLGTGLGGFMDGIVFHQILQWHEMLSNKIDVTTVLGKSVNMFWDGLFHAFCLIVVCIGVFLFWKALLQANAYHSSKLICAGLLLGWGIFNVTEGMIDHYLFKIHNVRELTGKQNLYNLLFIIYSTALIIIGWLLYKSELKKNDLQKANIL